MMVRGVDSWPRNIFFPCASPSSSSPFAHCPPHRLACPLLLLFFTLPSPALSLFLFFFSSSLPSSVFSLLFHLLHPLFSTYFLLLVLLIPLHSPSPPLSFSLYTSTSSVSLSLIYTPSHHTHITLHIYPKGDLNCKYTSLGLALSSFFLGEGVILSTLLPPSIPNIFSSTITTTKEHRRSLSISLNTRLPCFAWPVNFRPNTPLTFVLTRQG